MTPEIYLRKSGKTFGPYTEDEIASLRDSGELQDYSWIWDVSAKQWKPIDPPPAPPAENPAETTVARTSARVETEEREPVRSRAPRVTETKVAEAVSSTTVDAAAVPGLEVVCYDHVSVLTGRLQKATEYGAEFVSDLERGPAFSTKTQIFLNLLNPKSGESMSVSARLTGVFRESGHWVYRVRWTEAPELLRAAA